MMKLLISSILGKECEVNVELNTTILDLKKEIEEKIQVPAHQQTIVFRGLVLQDDKKIEAYPKLQDGTKLFIAIKKNEGFDNVLSRFLRQYYTDQQASQITIQFMKEFHRKLDTMSLDDLERLAKYELDNKV